MNNSLHMESAKAMQSAFRVRPELADEPVSCVHLGGVYSWRTPPMESFSLPESDDLIVALHLGGSRTVRAITDAGLSRSVSMPGLVTVLEPGRTAAFHTAGSISLVTLHIPSGVVQQQRESTPGRAPHTTPSQFAFRDAYASASMEALLRVAKVGAAPSPNYVGKLTDALLCHLISRDCPPDSDASIEIASGQIGHRPLDALLAYVDARISTKLSIDDLAAQAGLSRAAFNRAFRNTTGFSFHLYLTRRRISRARQMLRQTSFDLAYIAQELGFCNQSHFAAAFKALQNCTPGQYRNEQS